jgi:outer membrane lipoprotein-sorting protein
MNRIILGGLILLVGNFAVTPGLRAQTAPPTPAAILERIDRNAVPGSKIMISSMTVHSRRADRTIRSKSWVEGSDKAFTEYLDPPREKGIKMLKLGDQLWTFSPSTDRVISISGNLLRQSVMGSDLSYEDMMENFKLAQAYEAAADGEETMLDRPCWILKLTAVIGNTAYPRRRIWVDKDRFLIMKEERFAKSGRLLKTLEVKAVNRTADRWIQTEVVFRDVLKDGSGTEFKIESIEFDATIPEALFSKASLRK